MIEIDLNTPVENTTTINTRRLVAIAIRRDKVFGRVLHGDKDAYDNFEQINGSRIDFTSPEVLSAAEELKTAVFNEVQSSFGGTGVVTREEFS